MTRYLICDSCAVLGSAEMVGPGYIDGQQCSVCGLPNARARTDAAAATRAHLALAEKLRNETKGSQ